MLRTTDKILVSSYPCLSHTTTQSILGMLRYVLPETWQLCCLVWVMIYGSMVVLCWDLPSLFLLRSFLKRLYVGDLPPFWLWVTQSDRNALHLASDTQQSLLHIYIHLYTVMWKVRRNKVLGPRLCSAAKRELCRVRARSLMYLNMVVYVYGVYIYSTSLGEQDQTPLLGNEVEH